MIGRLAAVMGKEFRHIIRDPRSLVIIFLMPIAMTFLYGYAMNLDVKNIPLGVVDHDRSPASRELLEDFLSSGQFVLKARYSSALMAEDGMKRNESVLTLVIPAGYEQALKGGPERPIILLLDGSNGNTAAIALGYAQAITAGQVRASLLQMMSDAGTAGTDSIIRGIKFEPRFWFNPEQESSYYLVPALIAVILMMASALLTSVTVVREKESGTLEQLLVSPVRSGELVIGKALPYGMLALADGAFILLFGSMVFGVPIRGSLLVLFGFTGLYVMAALAIGLLISTVVNQQRVAMLGALLVTVLPSFMLSGFIFPIRSMPPALQIISQVVPARYYIPIVRGVLLKGVGADLFVTNGLFLTGLMLLLLAASVARFKPRLD
jgi:ABC-2 type transport system permease protein